MSRISCLSTNRAANTLFNPIESTVLMHQPVYAFTYVAAKIAHLLLIVFYMVPALAGPAALCGAFLKDARRIYPLTHMMAAILAGLFTSFLVCALYGWLFRICPPNRLKSLSLWLPVLIFAALPALGGIAGGFLAAVRHMQFDVSRWRWLPLSWFVALGFLGTRLAVQEVGWLGVLSIMLTAGVIWLGLRGFSEEYFQQAPAMIREHPGHVRGIGRSRQLTPVIRWLTGAPEGVAAYRFTSQLMRCDWQFRRSVFPGVLAAVLWIVAPSLKPGDVVSPLLAHRFSPAHFLPIVLGLMVLMACTIIHLNVSFGSRLQSHGPFESPSE